MANNERTTTITTLDPGEKERENNQRRENEK